MTANGHTDDEDAARAAAAAAQKLTMDRIASVSVHSQRVDPSFRLDNVASPLTLQVNDNLRIDGFTSVHGVRNYLNLPYGHIPGRFMPSRLVELDGLKGKLDATLYGPRCPQAANLAKYLVEHNYEKLGVTQRMSEFDCTNMNVYAPPEDTPGAPFPVFVHIHGGAFAYGDGLTEKDGNHLVKRSIEQGKPMVVVTFNYRLALLGFFTSQEILDEQEKLGFGRCAMPGLQDQRVALQWIQKYIHLFGGDPRRVTVSGESAGAHSIWHHLQGNASNLFSRCIMRSFPPREGWKLNKYQEMFDKLSNQLNVDPESPGYVKLAALRSMSVADLYKLWGGSAHMPMWDPDFMRPPSSPEKGPETLDYWTEMPDWVEAIVLGATRDECAVFGAQVWPAFSNSQVEDLIVNGFGPENSKDIMTSPVYTAAKTSFEKIYAVTSEGAFIQPILDAAEKTLQNSGAILVYFYLMETEEQHPGPVQGIAGHGHDLTYVFYMPAHRRYPEMAATSDVVAETTMKFAYGQEPWEELSVNDRYLAIDGTRTTLKHVRNDRRDRQVAIPAGPRRQKFYIDALGVVTERVAARHTTLKAAHAAHGGAP